MEIKMGKLNYHKICHWDTPRVAVLSLSLIFFGCTSYSHSILPLSESSITTDSDLPCVKPVKTIAVLPMKNNTMNFEGPEHVRKTMAAELELYGYSVQPIHETDALLRAKMGVALGGQLDLADPVKVGNALCVENILYGTLVDYSSVLVLSTRIKRVRGEFKLFNTSTETVVWEEGLGVQGEYFLYAGQGGGGGLEGVAVQLGIILVEVALFVAIMPTTWVSHYGDVDPPWINARKTDEKFSRYITTKPDEETRQLVHEILKRGFGLWPR